ncbi:MAG: hypothetical protein DIZ80_13565 [endosymbiont of Galathealinum brachiosum]|uniref:Thioredoxin domain-containing protein n=1 Tax=endosymbiont of Galathealinum brachiosum TaxID=2200906 RepID=A0A370D8B2_9GAMM|nr:MAG: hypothetical protein DIZ80_13565 [endosymbiont of Galathealinum brachiosum]
MSEKMSVIGLRNLIVFLLIFFSNTVYSNKAPDFILQGDDSVIKLSSYKGKVVYLDFWASWCVPCRRSFPFMNEMQEKYSEEGLKIIAVNLDTEREKAARFLKMIHADFSIAYDPEGRVPEDYKLSVVPTFYLISREGDIVYKHKGFRNSQNDELEAMIKRALSKTKSQISSLN